MFRRREERVLGTVVLKEIIRPFDGAKRRLFRKVQTLERLAYMPQILLGVCALVWLYPALRPQGFTQHILDQYARDRMRLPGDYRMLSWVSWGAFSVQLCLSIVWTLIRAFQIPGNQRLVDAGLSLVGAGCYIWWGHFLLRTPQRFRERWPRLPEWTVKTFGVALLLIAGWLLYSLIRR
jgi:hypothetical protein